jgi:gliding motility-associated lipoprotein GldH
MSNFGIELILFLAVLQTACSSGDTIGTKRMIDDRWLWADSLIVDYHHNRKDAHQDLMLVLEATDDYPFRNLYLRLWINQDSAPPRSSLHNFIINDVEGYWYADRSLWSSTYQMELPIARNLQLRNGQKLQFSLVHQLRTDTLHGVREVGLAWRPSSK